MALGKLIGRIGEQASRMRDALGARKNAIYNSLRYGYPDAFNVVDIETITACNRRCSYCPNSIYERGLIKNTKYLDTKLFRKIIDELAEIRFSGIINPNFYGEPLLDERIVELISYTRQKLPKARIWLYTNGDFLDLELYKLLADAGVNEFIITQHSKDKNRNILKIVSYAKRHPRKDVSIYYDKLHDVNNRAGLIPSGGVIAHGCRQFDPLLSIDHDGNVILCCQDYFSSYKFGNVRNEKLVDIWRKPRFQKLRKNIRERKSLPKICRQCLCLDDDQVQKKKSGNPKKHIKTRTHRKAAMSG